MVDVVVIGAGAAGIGAGRALQQLAVPHVIIEAKQRVGGRAFTDTSSLPAAWDHGCHWFHSADINVLRGLADKLGHEYRRERSGVSQRTFVNGVWHVEPVETAGVWTLLEAAQDAGRRGPDLAAAAVIPDDLPAHVLAAHWFELMYSQPPDLVSLGDAGNYNDTWQNLGVSGGYGALIARLAEGLPIRLATPAIKVCVAGRGVSVETPAGSIEARAAIVAVPARMLEMGQLRFEPGLPSAIAETARNVPMGYYEKVAFGFDRPVFAGLGQGDICDIADSRIPINFELNPYGRPIAVGHMAGPGLKVLADEGPEAMIAVGRDALVAAFGGDIRKTMTGAATTSWTADPWINGAYSCARPGKAHLRPNFAACIHDRVFLAGEHVHTSFMATAHGAFETGVAAAARAAALVGHPNPKPDPLWLPA